jgi:hypothetical protein
MTVRLPITLIFRASTGSLLLFICRIDRHISLQGGFLRCGHVPSRIVLEGDLPCLLHAWFLDVSSVGEENMEGWGSVQAFSVRRGSFVTVGSTFPSHLCSDDIAEENQVRTKLERACGTSWVVMCVCVQPVALHRPGYAGLSKLVPQVG